MKLVIVTHCLKRNDGQGRVNYEIAKAAAMSGHSVVLIADDVAPDLAALPGVRWIWAGHGPLPGALLRNFWFAATSGLALRRVRQDVDIVLVNGSVTIGDSDVNAIHFVHGGWGRSPYYDARIGLLGLYHRLNARLNTLFECRAFDCATRLVAVSAIVARELRHTHPHAVIDVVPNGVDCQEFYPKASLTTSNAHPVALFVGDLKTPRKNLDTVLKALVHTPELILHVAGDLRGSPYPALAQSLGVASRVLFLGHQNDMANVMRQADLFIFPSRYEPFGLVVLEAMASGLPVVTASTVGASDLVQAAGGEIIQDPDDVSALATAISRLLASPTRMKHVALAGREIALDHSWDQMAQGYLELFQRTLAARP